MVSEWTSEQTNERQQGKERCIQLDNEATAQTPELETFYDV